MEAAKEWRVGEVLAQKLRVLCEPGFEFLFEDSDKFHNRIGCAGVEEILRSNLGKKCCECK